LPVTTTTNNTAATITIIIITTLKYLPTCGLYRTVFNPHGAYKFGKIKFPEFSRFSRRSKQLFPIIKRKLDVSD